MGQILASGRTSVLVRLSKALIVKLSGSYTRAEPEIGLNASFEIDDLQLESQVPFELIEWCDAQKGGALEKLQELALENIQTA